MVIDQASTLHCHGISPLQPQPGKSPSLTTLSEITARENARRAALRGEMRLTAPSAGRADQDDRRLVASARSRPKWGRPIGSGARNTKSFGPGNHGGGTLQVPSRGALPATGACYRRVAFV